MLDLIFVEKDSDFNELVSHAKLLENNELILAKSFRDESELKQLKEKILKLKFKFKFCHLINSANPKIVNKFLGKTDFLAVLGGTPELNKFAVSNKKIDFLFQPVIAGKQSIDTAIMREARQNNKTIVFLFLPYLNASKINRMILFKNSFFCTKLMKKFKVKALVFSGAIKASEMRSVKDLNSFLVLLGFSKEQAKGFSEVRF